MAADLVIVSVSLGTKPNISNSIFVSRVEFLLVEAELPTHRARAKASIDSLVPGHEVFERANKARILLKQP